MNIYWLFHSDITTPYSVARRWLCGVVSRTEARSFLSLTQPALFIFCLRPTLAWDVRRAAILRSYHTKNAQHPWIFIHSSYHYINRIHRLV